MEKVERRCRSYLVSSGLGAIIFGIWSVAKLAMYILFDSEYIDRLIGSASVVPGWRTFVIVFIFIVTGIDMLLHFYVGFAARAEGRGKKKGYRYVVVTFFMIAFLAFGIIFNVSSDVFWENIGDAIVTLIIDLTSLFVLCDIAVASIRLKRMGRI